MKKGFGSINKSGLIMPVAVTCATLILSAILAVVFFNISRNAAQNASGAENNDAAQVQGTQNDVSEKDKTVLALDNDELRGVWVASIGNLNYPSKKELSKEELQKEIDAILDTCIEVGFNTVFFQVRPAGDALYESEIFPWSEYVSGTQGMAPDGEFDSLAYMLDEAEKRGIAVHAWVNPFRITNGSPSKPETDVSLLSENNPARIHPEYTVAYADGKLYYNPGEPGARALVISGITELCTKYPKLAGIHIDDYFYPYPSGDGQFDDSDTYAQYGGGMALADWRRNNVNTFVKEVYTAVKEVSTDLRFGVSPFGIWANSTSDTYVKGSETAGLEAYNVLYCDALAWAEGGYVDYIVPQLYWSFDTAAAPFDTLARWWNANLDGTGVDLYIGHGAYKAADYGKNEIPMQVEFARALLTYKGSVMYGYADIVKNTANLKDGLKNCFSVGVKYDEDSAAEEKKPEVNFPATPNTKDDSTYILGSSDPENPLTVNGDKVSRTKDGYFSYYTYLANGRNNIEIKANDSSIGYTINKVSGTNSSAPTEMAGFEITDVYPSKETWLSPGDTVNVSCSAPAGSKVTAKIGGITINLKPTLYSATTAKNYKEVYTGSVTIPTTFAPERGEADIGTLIFYAQKNGKSAQKSASLIKQLGKGALIYAEVKNDYSYFKIAPDSSFYEDPTPASIGMRDYIVGYIDGYYKLRCGYYVSEDNVNVVKGDALYDNKILSAVVEASVKDTTNNLNNHTDIRFSVLENVPVNVTTLKDKITITFFNTNTAFIPTVQIAKNPLVKECSGKAVGGNVVYEVTLIAAENYYGFNTVYEDGMIIFRLNNPQSLAQGDKPLEGKTIIVDAGHGGTDIGAPGPSSIKTSLHEADLNLSIALALRDKLHSLGATVVMIRDTDVTVDLYARIDILASMIPDMAISVHQNSVAGTVNASKVRGYLGLYSDCAGIMLANAVSDTVCTQLSRYQRPTAYQMLAVARNHRYPSTLCEMSFICNVEEFQWTISPGNYERSADALANGILEFYNRQAKYLEY